MPAFVDSINQILFYIQQLAVCFPYMILLSSWILTLLKTLYNFHFILWPKIFYIRFSYTGNVTEFLDKLLRVINEYLRNLVSFRGALDVLGFDL